MSIDLIGPDGATYELDNADPAALDEALRQGFKIPMAKQEKSGLEETADTAMAGIAGTVEGLTGGALGAIAGLAARPDKSGFVDPSGLAGRKELERLRSENPVASTAGEVAGMLVSPLNKAADLVRVPLGTATRGARIAGNVGGGAATGALFGAGKTLSDAALGDIDLTAEKLVAGIGLGALLGGAGGGVGSLIEEGARVVLPAAKTLAARARTALDDVANDAAISATRAQQGVINRIGDDKLRAAAEALRSKGLIRSSPDEMAKAIEAERSSLGKLLGGFLDQADQGGSKVDHMRMLNRLDDFESRLNPLERNAVASDLRSARKAVAELGAQGSGFRALDDLKQTIQAKAKFSRGPVPLDDTTLGLKRSLAGVFRDELDQQLLPVLGSDAGKAFTESKALYGALRDAERLAQSGAGRVGERGALGYVGLKDLLAGGVLGNISGPFGIAGAIGSKLMREHGPAIVARIADKLAKDPALTAVAHSLAAALPTVAQRLGAYAPALMQAAAHSPQHALAAHMAYAQVDPSYAATAQLAGLTPEQPDEHEAALGRAQSIAEAAAASRALDERVKKGVDRVARGNGGRSSGAMGSQDFGAMRMRREPVSAYLKRVSEVREMAANPQALVDRLAQNTGALSGAAPGVTASMANMAARAVAYLAKQAEVPPKAGPMAPEWDAPEADRFMFAAKLEVVQDPMSVLQNAASGELMEEQVEALRAVYPRLAQQIADAALERMLEAPADVPYSSRLMLSLLSGVDPDGSLSPEAIARNQAAVMASAVRERSGAQGAPDGEELSLASRTATPTQRREVRDEV